MDLSILGARGVSESRKLKAKEGEFPSYSHNFEFALRRVAARAVLNQMLYLSIDSQYSFGIDSDYMLFDTQEEAFFECFAVYSQGELFKDKHRSCHSTNLEGIHLLVSAIKGELVCEEVDSELEFTTTVENYLDLVFEEMTWEEFKETIKV